MIEGVRFRAFFPVHTLFPRPGGYASDNKVKLFEFLKTRRPVNISSFQTHDGIEVWAQCVKVGAGNKRKYFKDKIYIQHFDHMIQFEIIARYPDGALDGLINSESPRNGFTIEELPSVWASLVPSGVDTDIQTFLFALGVAFPGAVNIVDNVWFHEYRRFYYSSHYRTIIGDSVEYLSEHGIFPDVNVSPEAVFSALYKQNGLLNGRSDTPLSRAVSYLTRLYVRDFRSDELSDLAWALAGIEALLVDAGRSSIGQLKSKFAALLGGHSSMNWLNREIDTMYALRSKIVHGNKQLMSFFRRDELGNEKHEVEYLNASLLACGLLLLLIRRAISMGINKYEFDLVLASGSGGDVKL